MVTRDPATISRLESVNVPRQSAVDALVSSFAAAVDRSLMRTVSLVVEKQVLPRDVDLDMLRDSVASMLAFAPNERPRDFFRFVKALESPGDFSRNALRSFNPRSIRGGEILRRKLASSYRPYSGLPLGEDAAVPADPLLFQHWVHRAQPARGTVIILHGFAMGWPAIDAFALSARQWFERGLNVALLTLPDHGPRRPAGALFSGQSFTVPHAVRLAAAVRRAVHEIFELKRWLRSQDEGPVGLVGMSLGGYLASLCAGLSEDFDFLVPMVPPACMGDLAWRVYRQTGQHKAGPDTMLTEDNMRAAFYLHSPLAHPRKIARERILIAAGVGDRIVPPEHPTALWEHWDRPAIEWLRGGHVAPVASKPLMRAIDGHLKSLDIL